MKPFTTIAQGLPFEGDPHGASSPPLYQTATFSALPGSEARYDYSRSGNPTREHLEAEYAELEKARFGLAFASGMAAIRAVLDLLPLGGRVVAGRDLYGGTARLLGHRQERGALRLDLIDVDGPEALEAALRQPADLVLIESPSNPGLMATDLGRAAGTCRDAGALLVIDGSLLPPPWQRPLEAGADVVLHSATKYLAGHADVTCGLLATDDEKIAERLAFIRNAEGSALAPFEAWLTRRGLGTLGVRFERQSRTARLLRDRLQESFAEEASLTSLAYPEVEGPAGGVLVLELETEAMAQRCLASLRCFKPTVSFGSLRSTASLPACMSHASVPRHLKASMAPPAGLIRFSVGLEDVEDLAEDLQNALSQAISESRCEPGSRPSQPAVRLPDSR